MPSFDFVVETPVSRSVRARQLESAFDVPPAETSSVHLKGDLPIEDKDWTIGLIVGPSGSGKTTVLRELFGDEEDLYWNEPSVIDDFDSSLSIEDVTKACSAVGFNTIPAWLRPYKVLSNGERFRVELARRLVEGTGTVVVDEFTSVVDRQVAQIGAHAVQKYVRRRDDIRFVAVTCHYDVIEWLQPDWVFEPGISEFHWRSLQRRPELECRIARVPRDTWRVFAPYHYLTAELHVAAQCFGLGVNDRLAAFAGLLPRPVARGRSKGTAIWAVSRVVTLPDFQGLGLAFVLLDTLGAAHRAVGIRFRNYPAHPAFIRAHDRSPRWSLTKKSGRFSEVPSTTTRAGFKGGRPCAVFEYCGSAMESRSDAAALIGRGLE